MPRQHTAALLLLPPRRSQLGAAGATVMPAGDDALGAGWADVSSPSFSARMGHTATLWRDSVLIFGGRLRCVLALR